MLKKIVLCVLTLFVVGLQTWFIAVMFVEGVKQFHQVWQGFGVPVPAYTAWLFERIQDGTVWLLPLGCLVSGIWGAWQESHIRSAAAVGMLLLLTLALFGLAYAPVFLAGQA
ncbi:MAG: hypothetical protein Q4A62_04330 [Eikenella sp.]|nr:hypothetical protein [Eikenella sp.]